MYYHHVLTRAGPAEKAQSGTSGSPRASKKCLLPPPTPSPETAAKIIRVKKCAEGQQVVVQTPLGYGVSKTFSSASWPGPLAPSSDIRHGSGSPSGRSFIPGTVSDSSLYSCRFLSCWDGSRSPLFPSVHHRRLYIAAAAAFVFFLLSVRIVVSA